MLDSPIDRTRHGSPCSGGRSKPVAQFFVRFVEATKDTKLVGEVASNPCQSGGRCQSKKRRSGGSDYGYNHRGRCTSSTSRITAAKRSPNGPFERLEEYRVYIIRAKMVRFFGIHGVAEGSQSLFRIPTFVAPRSRGVGADELSATTKLRL